MEPEGSLPRLQVPNTSPYPEPDESRPCPTSHFLKIHFNVILPSKPDLVDEIAVFSLKQHLGRFRYIYDLEYKRLYHYALRMQS
jgi:hypothetical protein